MKLSTPRTMLIQLQRVSNMQKGPLYLLGDQFIDISIIIRQRENHRVRLISRQLEDAYGWKSLGDLTHYMHSSACFARKFLL